MLRKNVKNLIQQLSIESITDYYESACTDSNKIGIEIELFCVDSNSGYPISYTGDKSLLQILDFFVCRYDYSYANPDKFELKRIDEYISLEPGGQIEYSSPACNSINECKNKVAKFLRELNEILDVIGGIKIISQGILPNSCNDNNILIEKNRYLILADYLSNKGHLAKKMMKNTASIHINIDYHSEKNAMKSFVVIQSIGPIIASFFSNSHYRSNINYISYRKEIWNHTDKDRCGMLYELMSTNARFYHYVEAIIKIPLIYIQRDGRWIKIVDNITFEQFMEYGYKGFVANMSDYLVHLNSVFHDVRIKKYIEIRSLDAQPLHSMFDPVIFWQKILANPDMMDEVINLLSYATKSDYYKLHETIPVLGLDAKLGSKKASDILKEVMRMVKL